MTQTRHEINFFRADDATALDSDMMSMPHIAGEVREAHDISVWAAGQEVTTLFRGDGPDGFSLVHARFQPGLRLPRHTHSADCLYYVLRGTLQIGTRALAAGDGFFITADTPYGYTAGAEGVEVLEFRMATSFDMQIRDQTAASWQPIMDLALANHEKWLNA